MSVWSVSHSSALERMDKEKLLKDAASSQVRAKAMASTRVTMLSAVMVSFLLLWKAGKSDMESFQRRRLGCSPIVICRSWRGKRFFQKYLEV